MKISIFSFFLLARICLLSSFLQAAFDPGAAREAFDQGLASKNAGQLDEAERYFKKALEQEPSNADYHFELAGIYALERDAAFQVRDEVRAKESLSAAERELEQAVMIRPDFVAANFNLGVVYKKQGKYEQARAQFKKSMEITPAGEAVTPYLMQIASIYEDQGFYDDAESVYQEAMEKDYGNPGIRNALETLAERRQWSAERSRREQAMEAQNRWSGLSAMGRNRQNNGEGNAQPGIGQLIPSLGSWVVQQMMSRKGSQSAQP